MAFRRLLAPFLLVVSLVGCDHATKRLAASRLAGGPPVEIVSGLFSLEYVENRDAAFGALRMIASAATRRTLLIGLVGLVSCALLVWLWRRREDGTALERAGIAIVLAGALGNLVDRVAWGYVVDFFHLRWWPVFNVADIGIVAGVGALLVAQRRPPSNEPEGEGPRLRNRRRATPLRAKTQRTCSPDTG